MNLPLNLRLAAGLRVFACIRYALLNNLEQTDHPWCQLIQYLSKKESNFM